MRKSHLLAAVLLGLVSPIGISLAVAMPCVVEGPQYELVGDTVDWSMNAGVAQICRLGDRLRGVTFGMPEVISQPKFGQVTSSASGISYTSQSGFRGEDNFIIKITGPIKGGRGSSTIQIKVYVGERQPSQVNLKSNRLSLAPLAENSLRPVEGKSTEASTHDADDKKWQPLKIGAGGFITGIDIAPNGTKVIRTDTYGAYIWSNTALAWKQLVTSFSMPASDVGVEAAGGVYEIAIAPNRTSRLYMLFNGSIYRSDNSGENWSRTNFLPVRGVNANDGATKVMGRYMAVDPVNADILYAGTPSRGLWATNDGGESWHQIAAVGIGGSARGQGGGHLISFDPTSGVQGKRTLGIYISTYGTGVFHSEDGGETWSFTSGSPTTHNHMIVDPKGIVWLVDDSNAGAGKLNKYSNGHWSIVKAAGNQAHSIAVNPAHPESIYVGTTAGQLNISEDGGTKWSGPVQMSRTANDIPWLAWTNERYMSNGDMAYDPSKLDSLYFAEGIGVWNCLTPGERSPRVWISQNTGIENLVSTMVLAPAGGAESKPIVLAWDRPIFHVDDPAAYPHTHGPSNDNSIIMGWSADWAATTPSTIVALANWADRDLSGVSRDGGRTWTSFPSKPLGHQGGSIAALNAANFIWVQNDNGNPYFTTDGGDTWTQIRIPGIPTSGTTGWGFAYYTNRQIVTADRVSPATAYIYNYLTSPNVAGVYKTTDGGASWARVYSGSLAGGDAFASKLKSVPQKSGHLFFTAGTQSAPHPARTPLLRSVDGGITWTKVGNFMEVADVGFGTAFPGHDYPAIYVAGYNGDAVDSYGIWRSIDNARSWTRIGVFPVGIFSAVQSIDGDKITFGVVYVALSGSGFAYRKDLPLSPETAAPMDLQMHPSR